MVNNGHEIKPRDAKARFVILWGMAIATSVLIFGVKSARDRGTLGNASNGKLEALYHEYSYTQIHMAMPVRLTVYSTDETIAKDACRAAFRRIKELVKVFSDYDPESEISRLVAANKINSAQPHPVSQELLRVLLFAKQVHAKSQGAFDPTAGPCIKLWRNARKSGILPPNESIEEAWQRVGFEQILINEDESTVTWPVAVSLDFGAIAKGFIGDEAISTLNQHGLNSACYEAGGDFVIGDAPPGSGGWEIDIPFQGPQLISNGAVSVSGDTVQFVVLNGKRYSHVIDPRTGMAVTNRRMTVVRASSGMCSDALATTGGILAPEAFNELIEQFPDVKAWQYAVTDENEESL